MAKIRVNHQKPAVLCDMPSNLAAILAPNGGRAFGYASKNVGAMHLDSGVEYREDFTLTGIFRDETSGEVSNLLKATQVVFDCDLVDVAMHGNNPDGSRRFPKMMEDAQAFFAAQGVSTVYATSKTGTSHNVSDASADLAEFDKKKAINHAVMKAYLASLKPAQLKTIVMELLPEHLEFMAQQLNGVKPSVVNYSGTGYHLHYFLSDNDGWTQLGLEQLAEDARDGLILNIEPMKLAYKRLNGQFKQKFGYSLDDKLSQIGTAATRDIGSQNTKHSGNIKVVESLYPVNAAGDALVDIDARLCGADFKLVEVPEAEKHEEFKQKVKAAGRPVGRPKKFSPKKLNDDAQITLAVAGTQHTISVGELWEAWEELVSQGVVQVEKDGKQKLVCRLDWVSNGSLNAWCRKDPSNEKGGILFTLNVPKYDNVDPEAWNEDPATGNKVGHWVYTGGIMGLLEVNDKGRVLLNTNNIKTILENEPRLAGRIRYNTRANVVEVRGDLVAAQYSSGNYSYNSLDANMWLTIDDNSVEFINTVIEYYCGTRMNFDALNRAIGMVARMLKSEDPAQDWIASLKWDGKNRLDTWLPEVLRIAPTHPRYASYAAYGRVAMLSIARLTFSVKSAPVRIGSMLIFHGSQASGKSTLARTLAATHYLGETYFSESELQFNKPADLALQLQGKIVAEVPELDAFAKAEITAIKAFLTKGAEDQRTAYSRNMTRFQNTAFLVGTTNHRHILRDTTGNRRFMVVDFDDMGEPLGKRWDMPAFVKVIPQLYAEAHSRAVLGVGIPANRATNLNFYGGVSVEDWGLTPAETEVQADTNRAFETSTPEQDALTQVLNGFVEQGKIKNVKLTDVVQQLKLQFDVVIRSNNIISNTLQSCGWVRHKSGGLSVWSYAGSPETPKPEGDKPTPPTGGGSDNSEPRREPKPEAPKPAPSVAPVQADMFAEPQSEATTQEPDMNFTPVSNTCPLFVGHSWHKSEELNGDPSDVANFMLKVDPLTCSVEDFLRVLLLARLDANGKAKALTQAQLVEFVIARGFIGWSLAPKDVLAKIKPVLERLKAAEDFTATRVKQLSKSLPSLAYMSEEQFEKVAAVRDLDLDGDDLDAIFNNIAARDAEPAAPAPAPAPASEDRLSAAMRRLKM